MAEEVMRMQETGTEPVKAAEPMGTVISMESVKPAAESFVCQESSEGRQNLEGAEKPVETDTQVQPQGLEEPQPLSGAMGHIESESTGGDSSLSDSGSRGGDSEAAFYEQPLQERKRDFSSEIHFTEPKVPETDSDREKKRISDFFHFRKNIEGFTREDWILSRIPAEDLMEYLTMEQKKNEMLQKAKEVKEKRIFTTLQIALSMAAIVGVVALLRDNPTVLVNILYITGIVIALWIWRGKQDK